MSQSPIHHHHRRRRRRRRRGVVNLSEAHAPLNQIAPKLFSFAAQTLAIVSSGGLVTSYTLYIIGQR